MNESTREREREFQAKYAEHKDKEGRWYLQDGQAVKSSRRGDCDRVCRKLRKQILDKSPF